MQIPIFHVDAFTNTVFSGNPAAVCLLPEWIRDNQLHAIAKENNLPVTAFLVRKQDHYEIRWITPEYELDLCGHGSLCAGYVIFNILEPFIQQVKLKSRVEMLAVIRDNNRITLDFPTKTIVKCNSYPVLEKGLGLMPSEIFFNKKERCVAVFDSEEQIINLHPDMQVLKQVEHNGVVVTAPGDKVDFVSRTFYPKLSLCEDAVTGSSHCLLVPYWSKRLNKNKLHALQVSDRRGELFCEQRDDRVFISGTAILYSHGEIQLSVMP